MKVQALILSQFHIKKGFTIIKVVQKQNHITSTQFTIYSELILFREQLCGRLLVSEFLENYYLIGVPSLSVNTQEKNVYQRAKYLYSVSILVYKQNYLNENYHEVYKQIAYKLAYFFKFIQETSNIIYQNFIPENNQYLSNLLAKAFNHINNNEECVLSHFSNCFTIINLNRSPYEKDKKDIKKSYVPLTFLLQSQIQDIQSEFGKKLLRFAKTGDFNIKKICELVEDQKSVCKYYYKCMEMGLVFMADMFSLQNRYTLTEKIHRYVGERSKKHENELRKMCEQISIKKGNGSNSSIIYSSNNKNQNVLVTPNLVLYLFFQLNRKTILKKVIDDNIQIFENINILKWIRISQILGIITRIHEKFGLQQSKQITHQIQFISEERVQNYIEHKSSKYNSMLNVHASLASESSSLTSNIKEQYEQMNSLFNMHLKNMDTIDEICVSLKVSKPILLNLLNYNIQKNLKIFYVLQ